MRTEEKPIKKTNRKRKITEKLRLNEAFDDEFCELGDEYGEESEAYDQNTDEWYS